MSSLPERPFPLIGRRREIAAALRQIRRDDVRLFTITGPAGVGKTHFAIEVASGLTAAFADGVVFVDLAPVRDPELVAQGVARALAVREAPDQPVFERLTEHLQDRQMLVLLDNFEQVLEAATLVAGLLEGCPTLKVLVTSRAPLRIGWEHQFPLAGLAAPDMASPSVLRDLRRFPAVSLFITRAQRIQPSFALTERNAAAVAEICARLEGVPLAIELAAARVGVMSAEDMVGKLERALTVLTDGLRDSPLRHKSLRAAIDWSYALLQPAEQRLFRRLSVFVGGCTPEAAVAVCKDDEDLEEEITTRLHSLVEQNLQRHKGSPKTGSRLYLLETIRQYAAERLSEAGEEGLIRDRHLAWCLAVMEEAFPHVTTQDAVHWLDRVEMDYPNLRAALEWSLGREDSEAGLRLAGLMGQFWWIRGMVEDGRKWLGAALDRAPRAATEGRAMAAGTAGSLATIQGDYAAARLFLEESLSIRRELGDKNRIATSLNALAYLARFTDDNAEAKRLYEECLVLWQERGNRRGVANAIDGLGNIALGAGDTTRARSHFEESLVIFKELGNRRGIRIELENLGSVALAQGDFGRAQALFEEALMICRELKDKQGLADLLNSMGSVRLAQGDPAAARARILEALAHQRELGSRLGVANSLSDLGVVALEQGDLASARALLEECLGIKRSLGQKQTLVPALNLLAFLAVRQDDFATARALLTECFPLERDSGDRIGLAFSLEAAAGLATASGDAERAARLLGAAEGLRDATSTVLPPVLRRFHEEWIEDARKALTSRGLEQTWAIGRTLGVEQMLEGALAEAKDVVSLASAVEPLSIRLLGEFEVRKGETLLPRTAWGRRRHRLLFMYLLLAGEAVRREALLEALWPNLDAASAGASLRVAWSGLKRAFEPDLPEGHPSAYLEAERERFGVRWSLIRTDVLDFERFMARLRHARTHAQKMSLLESVVALYRGDLLPDDANEPWTTGERERLRSLYLSALQQLAEGKERLGRVEEAVQALQTIIRLDPWREEAYRWLMRLLVDLGQRSEALYLYRQCEAMLRRELGVAPAPETTALFEAIAATARPSGKAADQERRGARLRGS